ncbi:MAG: hypothetical protein K2Z80_25065 [Xanthobacteraceae bacterium]|nr:hypothetical protein [Xanthobacteraceae bacterium]
MAKYAAFGAFLRKQKAQHVPLTFGKIEEIIGGRLPASARYSAWWSNNPTNNVMTRVWLEAGFRSEQVDIAGRKVVFRRVSAPVVSHEASPKTDQNSTERFHPLFGALKGLTRISPDADLTEPADPDWGRAYD